MKTRTIAAVCVAVFGLAVAAFPQAESEKPRSEQYSAMAFLPAGAGMRMVGPGANTTLNIYIKRYSTDAEAQQLRQALLTGGQDAVTKILEKMSSIGKVSLTGRVGFFDLKFIRSRPTEAGRMIVAACDRPIQFLEAYHSGRSMDYSIGIMQMNLKQKGGGGGKEEGEGVLIYAAKIKVIEGNTVEIENYGVEPAKLMAVRKLK
ncbi:MAG TPA: hypothetical protein VG778_07450 [Blastocatellia bacterium]|jgi:hypothetical protein|nr:hypothetical protein [Blastocatellia bacterium]